MGRGSSNSIASTELKDTIKEYLDSYDEEISSKVKKITKGIKDELVQDTKRDANELTGEYKANITATKTGESSRHVTYTWHVKDPEYRLSHLLEKGHALRNGGRSKAFGFISKNEKKAIENFISRIEGVA